MAIEDKIFSGDTLRVGYRFQRHWDNSMAAAFFCAELGAGLFFIGLLLDSLVGMLLGLILVSTGKPYFHLTHMGVPARSWRAMLRPDRSWISRGLLALVSLVGLGGLYVLSQYLPGAQSLATTILQGLAGLAALIVMTYQGFAMSHSSAIAIWNSAILPLASLLYALATGLAVSLIFIPADIGVGLYPYELLLLLGVGFMHLMLLHAGWHGSPGARTSVELLLHTFYARWFWGLTIGLGLVLPALLLWWTPGSPVGAAVAAAGILAGFFSWRVLIFKIGVYEPVISMNPFHSAS